MKNKIYAFKHTSNVIKESSSGGAFTAIIDVLKNQIRDKKLIIYGACFNEEFKVIHRGLSVEEDWTIFRGSKYVWSDLGKVFQDIQIDLEEGHYVLFTGVPCQIAALKRYCTVKNIITDNLLLVDIICHGTADPRIWKDYIYWLESKNNSKLKRFSFRYRNTKWLTYPTFAEFNNGIKKDNTLDIRLFTNLFFTNLPMRKGCYTCKFANMNRHSDLTIGDFWGIENIVPSLSTEQGVSQIIVNSCKGDKILCNLQEICNNSSMLLIKCTDNSVLKYQHNLNEPTKRPDNVDIFWKEYEKYGIEYILKKYAGNNFRGIIKHGIKKILYITNLMDIVRKFK